MDTKVVCLEELVGEDVIESPAKRYMTSRYEDYTFDDETSAYDPKGVWRGGSEYYSRTYRCRVPKGLLNGPVEKLDAWIANHSEALIWYQ